MTALKIFRRIWKEPLDLLVRDIDHAAAIQHVVASVAAADVVFDPFPYVILKDVFDEDTHDALLRLVRLDALFRNEEGGTAYTIFRYPQLSPAISPEVCDFVRFLAEELVLKLSEALRKKFDASLLQWGHRLAEKGVYQKPAEAMLSTELRAEFHPYDKVHARHDGMTSQFEIMRRTQDFAIAPHCHPVRELLIGLFPITADDSLQDYGTDLFRIKPGCSVHMDVQDFSYVSPDMLDPAARTKFLRNSAFVMLNCVGIHAYTPPPLPRARNYLYTTLLIGDQALAPSVKARPS